MSCQVYGGAVPPTAFHERRGAGGIVCSALEINTYTLKAAFDPLYEPSYWTRFALGLIAGVLLADLVSANE